VQSVRGAASAKGWGIKHPTPFCALGIRPARLCAGPFIKGRAALCRRCGNPFFQFFFSQFGYGRALFPRLPP
jgi:hypothetical protein